MAARFAPEIRERRSAWRSLVRALRPVDRTFFACFAQQAQLCVEALSALVQLLANTADPDGRVREIEAIEKRADSVVDETRAALRRSLFPPYGRMVVHELSNSIDDILDVAEDAAQSLLLYHVTAVTPEAQRLAELALTAASRLQQAIAQLPRLDHPRAILALCAEVDDLEAQADHVQRTAMSNLFRVETEAAQLVKMKAIYEVLEELTDRCKDVANEIEAIVLRQG